VVWDTTVEANAPVTLKAVATDLVGLTAESTVGVTVRNTGAVSGRITDNLSGLPLSGATVTLLSGPLLPVASTTTDAGGLYSFTDVPTGSYLVRASAGGYGTEAVGAVVEAGLTTTVDIALDPRPGAITGTVTAADTGLPLAGATVRALHEGVLAAETVTDAAGHYLLDGLAAGLYVVTASRDDYQSASVGATVQPGETTTVDFALGSDPGVICGTVTEAALIFLTLARPPAAEEEATPPAPSPATFRSMAPEPAVLAGEAPITGAVMSLHDAAGLLVSQTVTAADGTYFFRGVAPGSYLVTVRASGFAVQGKGAFPGPGEYVMVDFSVTAFRGRLRGRVTAAATGLPIVDVTVSAIDTGVTVAQAVTDPDGRYLIEDLAPESYVVTFSNPDYQDRTLGAIIGPGQTTTLDAALASQPASVSGQVTSATTGLPLAGAQVVVLTEAGIRVATAVTDSGGRYQVDGLAAGSYTLVFEAANFQSKRSGVILGPGDAAVVNQALESNPGALRGTVSDAQTGEPLAGAAAVLRTAGGIPVASVLTDDEGVFFIPGLAPSLNYKLTVTRSGYAGRALSVAVAAGATTDVAVALTPQPGRVSGTVTRAATGRPLPGVEVHALGSDGVMAGLAVTGPDGRYLIEDLAPGTYNLSYHLDGFAERTVGLILEPSQEAVVNVTLVANPGTIRGRVTSAVTGEPLEGVEVKVYDSSDILDATVLTDPDGRYVVSGRHPDAYTLVFTLEGFGTAEVGALVGPGETVEVDARLVPGVGWVRITVLCQETGLPLVGAEVVIRNAGGTIVETLLTGPDGVAAAELGPGEYTAVARARFHAPVTVGFCIVVDETTAFTIELSVEFGFIRGTVVSAKTGRPLAGASVRFASADGVPVVEVLTDTQGGFCSGPLASGSHFVVARHDGFADAVLSVVVAVGETRVIELRLKSFPGRVSGTVTDAAAGTPITGATASLLYHTLIPIGKVVTGADGRYLFDTLQPGSYSLVFRAPGYQAKVLGFSIPMPGQSVVVNAGLEKPPSGVRGQVVAADTGLPIPGATVLVALSGSEPVVVVTADSQGNYVATGLAPRPYLLTASARGWADQVRGAAPGPGETATVDFSLSPFAGAIQGQVTDAETGEPINCLPLVALTTGGVQLAATLTCLGGMYRIEDLPVGYLVVAFQDLQDHQGQVVGALIRDGETTVVNAALRREPGRLEGRVIDASTGLPVTVATVELFSFGGVPFGLSITGAGGSYSFEGLPEGTFVVSALAPGYGAVAVPVSVAAGRTTTRDILLDPAAGVFTGRITDATTGEPVAGAAVSILTAGNLRVGEVATCSRGIYRTPGLAPGDYFLVFSGPGYAARSFSVTAEAGVETVVDVALEPDPGLVEGFVTDARTGEPLVAEITAKDAAGAIVVSVPGAGTGFYRLERLRGTYAVRLYHPGYVPEVRVVAVGAGQVVRLDVALLPQEAVKVRSVKAELVDVTSDFVRRGLLRISAGLLVDLIYLPRGSDQLALAHRRLPFDRLMEVPAGISESLIEGEARVVGTFAHVRSSGIVDVTITILLRAVVGRPDVEETTVVTVAVDPSEEQQV